LLQRRFVKETFCRGDVLIRRRFVRRRFVEETFCKETFCMCVIKRLYFKSAHTNKVKALSPGPATVVNTYVVRIFDFLGFTK
jgi:hypothetical protein